MDKVSHSQPVVFLLAMRPKQWIKNLLVFGAWFFAVWDPTQRLNSWQTAGASFLIECLACLVFCLLSSAVYLFNDIRDLESDRCHPQKKLRMIASGALPVRRAVGLLLGCLVAGLAGAALLPKGFLCVCLIYLLLQAGYSGGLKRIPSVDVFLLSAGFVLRAVAGAFAVSVRISPWLLLCVFLLSLFIALCKRRNELMVLQQDGHLHREALAGYGPVRLLDIQIAIASSCVVVCYSIYTLSSETISRFGTDMLVLTVPFVLFAIFRYLYLVYGRNLGGRPEQALLTDWVMIITVLLWGVSATVILALAAMGKTHNLAFCWFGADIS